jgi:hypothetical protein
LRVSIDAILRETWRLYTSFFARFAVIALTVFLIVNLVNALVSLAIGEGVGAAALLGLIGVVVSIVGMFWLQGALVYAVADVRDGRFDSSTAEVFGRVRPHLGALVGAGLLAGLGIVAGLALLVVPGLVLLTWWCLIVPVIVLERRAIGEAFSRSRALVRGHGWSVFGLIVIVLVVGWIAQAILIGLLSFLGDFLQAWIGGAVAAAVVYPFIAIALVLTYFELAGEPAPGPEPAPQPAQ